MLFGYHVRLCILTIIATVNRHVDLSFLDWTTRFLVVIGADRKARTHRSHLSSLYTLVHSYVRN